MKKLYLFAPFLLGASFEIVQRRKLRPYFEGKSILISGGSTGLGFALAKRLLSYGANVSICGRDERKLQQAKKRLLLHANHLHVFQCDVASREKVNDWVGSALERFGKIDMLINNAGILTVGPVESQSNSLYRENLDIMLWGHLNTCQEVIPKLKNGQIVNIISVGGKISIPHMSSYSVAKSAAAAYSEGLGVELAKDGIAVSTIYPWLLRTGSYGNGFFPQGDANEFRVFSLGSALPGLAMNVDAAVTEILIAARRKKSQAFIGLPAKLVTLAEFMLPDLSRRVLALASKLLLSPPTTKNFIRGRTLLPKEFAVSQFFGDRERRSYQHTMVSGVSSEPL